jgi:hypothetical protein
MLSYVASVAASVALAAFGVSDLVVYGRESAFVVPGHLSHQNVQSVLFAATTARWQNEDAFDSILNRGCRGPCCLRPSNQRLHRGSAMRRTGWPDATATRNDSGVCASAVPRRDTTSRRVLSIIDARRVRRCRAAAAASHTPRRGSATSSTASSGANATTRCFVAEAKRTNAESSTTRRRWTDSVEHSRSKSEPSRLGSFS